MTLRLDSFRGKIGEARIWMGGHREERAIRFAHRGAADKGYPYPILSSDKGYSSDPILWKFLR